jgi:hypothetical protein
VPSALASGAHREGVTGGRASEPLAPAPVAGGLLPRFALLQRAPAAPSAPFFSRCLGAPRAVSVLLGPSPLGAVRPPGVPALRRFPRICELFRCTKPLSAWFLFGSSKKHAERTHSCTENARNYPTRWCWSEEYLRKPTPLRVLHLLFHRKSHRLWFRHGRCHHVGRLCQSRYSRRPDRRGRRLSGGSPAGLETTNRFWPRYRAETVVSPDNQLHNGRTDGSFGPGGSQFPTSSDRAVLVRSIDARDLQGKKGTARRTRA